MPAAKEPEIYIVHPKLNLYGYATRSTPKKFIQSIARLYEGVEQDPHDFIELHVRSLGVDYKLISENGLESSKSFNYYKKRANHQNMQHLTFKKQLFQEHMRGDARRTHKHRDVHSDTRAHIPSIHHCKHRRPTR
jgi:hypothetical protein